jgi:hypothetical protein
MTIQEACATIQQQTAYIQELKEENKQLEARVAELTPFRSDFQGLQDRFWALKTSESSLSGDVALLKGELDAAMQIVKSHADELKQNQTALDRAEQNFRNFQKAVVQDVSSNVLKGVVSSVVSNAASIVAKKTAAAVASTQTEAEVSAASDLDKIASDLEKTRAVASSESKILDLSTEILTLTIRNHALTTRVESLQVDLDGARQALATQTKAPATQIEAPAKGNMQAVFAAGTVAVIAIAALAVAKNPAAVEDAAVKGVAFVAEKASSVVRSVSAFFNNGIEIDLT